MTIAPRSAPPAVQPKRLVPRDAATLVLVEGTGAKARILMGRRRADLVFLAGKYVFPGGRVDPDDRRATSADELGPGEIEKLLNGMRGRPSRVRARALAMAAIRETREETGLVIGDRQAPRLSCLRLFARAITPPGRPRRFDTRFFMADAASVTSGSLEGDGELLGLDWFTLDDARGLDLPGITRLIVEDIAGAVHASEGSNWNHVPFYYHRNGSFRRDLL